MNGAVHRSPTITARNVIVSTDLIVLVILIYLYYRDFR